MIDTFGLTLFEYPVYVPLHTPDLCRSYFETNTWLARNNQPVCMLRPTPKTANFNILICVNISLPTFTRWFLGVHKKEC